MTLTTATRTIEISWGSLYLNFPRFGLHVQRDATAPVLGFEKVTHADGWEVWCLGFYAVYDRNH